MSACLNQDSESWSGPHVQNSQARARRFPTLSWTSVFSSVKWRHEANGLRRTLSPLRVFSNCAVFPARSRESRGSAGPEGPGSLQGPGAGGLPPRLRESAPRQGWVILPGMSRGPLGRRLNGMASPRPRERCAPMEERVPAAQRGAFSRTGGGAPHAAVRAWTRGGRRRLGRPGRTFKRPTAD